MHPHQNIPEDILVILLIVFLQMALLVGFIAFISFLYMKRQTEALKKIEEAGIQLSEAKNQQENVLLKARLDAQKDIVQHIAMEVHDQIGQQISFALFNLHTMETVDAAHREKKEASIHSLESVMVAVRDISRILTNDLVLAGGLESAIQQLVDQVGQSCIPDIRFIQEGEYLYPGEKTEIFLYRIVQESINNILRHAEANRVRIHLSFTSLHIHLSIQDNGKGFDPRQLPSSGNASPHSGLRNMKERSVQQNADLVIDSKPGKGTRIQVNASLIPNHD